jgi:hypothetical protein
MTDDSCDDDPTIKTTSRSPGSLAAPSARVDAFGRLFGWAVCVAFAACAETTRVAPDGAAPRSANELASFFERTSELACRQPAGCPGSDASAYYASAATCMAASRRYVAPYRRQLLEQVALGRVRFDPAAAARCLADLADHCGTDVREACLGVLAGTVAPGGACELAQECVPGSYCDHGEPGTFACAGRCVATSTPPGSRPPGNLSSCRADPGATAYFDGSRCVSARFGAPAALGEACDVIDAGDGRVRLVRCVDGLACAVTALRQSGRCVRPLDAGAGCAAGDVCPPGFVCDATATTAGRCAPYGLTHVAGGPCVPGRSSGGAPPSCDPLEQLECGDDGRCVRVGDGREGSRCVPGVSVEGLCDEGLFCDRAGDAPTCRRQREVGEPCVSETGCRSGACRDRVCATRICQ